MVFIDINNKEHIFELNRKYRVKTIENSKSNAQFKLGCLLSKIYGKNNLFEDYPLPGCGNLSWDFWIPFLYLAFEFHGKQHFEFVPFFHATHAGFRQQNIADDKKQKIADANKVRLIVVQESDFTEWTVDELKGIINRKI